MCFFTPTPISRRRRNHIHSLVCNGRTIIDEQSKAEEIYSYFDSILGSASTRSNGINVEALGLPSIDLHELGDRFTEDEIWGIIRALPTDKASGPYGLYV
jgi:hypothetical protein